MKVKSIAECSHWSILQYFCPALSKNRSRKPILGLLFEWSLKTGFAVYIGLQIASGYSLEVCQVRCFRSGPQKNIVFF